VPCRALSAGRHPGGVELLACVVPVPASGVRAPARCAPGAAPAWNGACWG